MTKNNKPSLAFSDCRFILTSQTFQYEAPNDEHNFVTQPSRKFYG